MILKLTDYCDNFWKINRYLKSGDFLSYILSSIANETLVVLSQASVGRLFASNNGQPIVVTPFPQGMEALLLHLLESFGVELIALRAQFGNQSVLHTV
jgi:hypothetical protein